jgi:hypothetical protein
MSLKGIARSSSPPGLGGGHARAAPGGIPTYPVRASKKDVVYSISSGDSVRSRRRARRLGTVPRVAWQRAPLLGAQTRAVRSIGPRGEAVAGGQRHRTATIEAVQPTIEAVQATIEAVQATIEAVQATIEAVQPTIEAVQPTIEAVQATIDRVQATIEAVQPADGSCTGSIVACTRSIVACTRSIVACTRPIVACTRPIVACTRPIVACTRPIVACTASIVALGCPDGRSGRCSAPPRHPHPARTATGAELRGPRRAGLAAAGAAGLRAESSRSPGHPAARRRVRPRRGPAVGPAAPPVVAPPFSQPGVLALDTFMPRDDGMALAGDLPCMRAGAS